MANDLRFFLARNIESGRLDSAAFENDALAAYRWPAGKWEVRDCTGMSDEAFEALVDEFSALPAALRRQAV